MNVVVIVRLIEIYTPLYIEIHHISILVHVPIPLTRTLSSGRPPRRSGPMDAASPIMLIIPFMKIALHLTCLTSSALRNRRPSSHFSSDPMPHFTLDSSKRMLFTNSDQFSLKLHCVPGSLWKPANYENMTLSGSVLKSVRRSSNKDA